MASILLIDDDDLFRTTLADALTESGHKVIQAADGDQGMILFRATPTDLVLTDIVMPNQDGTATVARLRREFPQLGIIAMSGGLACEPTIYLEIARTFGADSTIEKPFKMTALLQAIEDVLASQKHIPPSRPGGPTAPMPAPQP